MKTFSAVIAVLACLAAAPAFAQATAQPQTAPVAAAPDSEVDPQRLTAARGLIEMTHSSETMAQLMKQFSANMSATILRDNPDKQLLVQHMIDEDLTPVFLAHTHEMQENSAISYAQHFTLDELNELAAFYRTPTGQKYLQAMPAIVGETMKANRALIIGIVAEATSKLKQDMQKNKLHVPKEMGI